MKIIAALVHHLKTESIGIDIGIGIFNTFQMEKSIEVLGIQ